jgi:hypothetical protein
MLCATLVESTPADAGFQIARVAHGRESLKQWQLVGLRRLWSCIILLLDGSGGWRRPSPTLRAAGEQCSWRCLGASVLIDDGGSDGGLLAQAAAVIIEAGSWARK